MKNWHESGGAAFPVPDSDHLTAESGMSLRDYFAGQALPGLTGRALFKPASIAMDAYELADAMLAQRNK